MLNIHEIFRSRAAAMAFIAGQVGSYPPAVFGTNLQVYRDRFTGEFVVNGHRFK